MLGKMTTFLGPFSDFFNVAASRPAKSPRDRVYLRRLGRRINGGRSDACLDRQDRGG
ncbi:unnamed protein product [Ciceribacter selenitireducens ATCC BAA-1503]|uniref:Uncharacterized protein n=1 Tax=Ciceribacter selenitireducens ATCC BAA-1503 TaxID=1336235 RepID=A0A376AB19_9HYPH|nr:unnamed protein product [Ciceribacter selenitireducens ATCC BAA-1503]